MGGVDSLRKSQLRQNGGDRFSSLVQVAGRDARQGHGAIQAGGTPAVGRSPFDGAVGRWEGLVEHERLVLAEGQLAADGRA